MTATEYGTEQVVLVDEQNNEIGLAEKMQAHEQNLLHRAFSVFIFRPGNPSELLLQQRALHKYHSPGLWTNTCCSHPRQGEDMIEAGKRRLFEEMGIKIDSLKDLGWFHYNAHFPNGLSENEIDHVLVGVIDPDMKFQVNPDEVHAIKWITIEALQDELAIHPEQFTPWLDKALQLIKNKKSFLKAFI